METVHIHSNDRTMENLTKGIPGLNEKPKTKVCKCCKKANATNFTYCIDCGQYLDDPIENTVKKLAEDEEKILSNTLLCTQINEGILIEKA